MRLIDADALMETIRAHEYPLKSYFNSTDRGMFTIGIQQSVDEQPTIPSSPWHRVEDELPKEPGEYIVAYHPCYWEDVDTSATKVGIDNFRGKSAWAKKKFQRVTHWMEKPEPPKEDA